MLHWITGDREKQPGVVLGKLAGDAGVPNTKMDLLLSMDDEWTSGLRTRTLG